MFVLDAMARKFVFSVVYFSRFSRYAVVPISIAKSCCSGNVCTEELVQFYGMNCVQSINVAANNPVGLVYEFSPRTFFDPANLAVLSSSIKTRLVYE